MSDLQRQPSDDLQTAPAGPPHRKLRLWPAFVIVALQLAAMYGPTAVLQLRGEPPTANAGGEAVEKTVLDNPQVVLIAKALGPLIGTVLLFLWWVGFSRAPWKARLIGPIVLAAVGWISLNWMHPTMNLGFLLYAVPTATTAALVALLLLRDTRFCASRNHCAGCRRDRIRDVDDGANGWS